MYYTYVLQSEVDHHFYVGYSMDLKLRGEMGKWGNGDVYVFKFLSPIKSNRFSFSIVSPRFDSRLAAG